MGRIIASNAENATDRNFLVAIGHCNIGLRCGGKTKFMSVTCFLGSQISICPKSNRLSPSDQKPTDNSGCAHYIGRIQQLGLSANETLETFVEQQDMFVKSFYQTTGLVNVYLC